jgi:MoxR-like ATPase
MRLPVGYPAPAAEQTILHNLQRQHPITLLNAVDFDQHAGGLDALARFQRAVWEVHLDETLVDYIVRLVAATRIHPDVILGGSPRASLALFKTSQALAAIKGRDHVLPDDIKYLLPFVLIHRLIIKPEAELRGRKASQILQEIIDNTRLDLGEAA